MTEEKGIDGDTFKMQISGVSIKELKSQEEGEWQLKTHYPTQMDDYLPAL